ncbi:MAG: hypothetical protein ABI318_23535 [Chthoniobacteraceae bacterium]
MKTSRLLATLLAVVICAFATDVAFAKGRAPKNKPTPEPAKGTSHSVIASVSNNVIALKNSHDTKSYKIDGRTAITLDGGRAGVGALKAGMYAEVTASTIDPGLAVAVDATNPKSH